MGECLEHQIIRNNLADITRLISSDPSAGPAWFAQKLEEKAFIANAAYAVVPSSTRYEQISGLMDAVKGRISSTTHEPEKEFAKLIEILQSNTQLEDLAKKLQKEYSALQASASDPLGPAPPKIPRLELATTSSQKSDTGCMSKEDEKAHPGQCNLVLYATFNTTSTIAFRIRDTYGRLCTTSNYVRVQIKSLVNESVPCERAGMSTTGMYTLPFTPSTRGRHNLSITVNSKHIEGSPFDLFVELPVSQLRHPIRAIKNKFGMPYSITIRKNSELIFTDLLQKCFFVLPTCSKNNTTEDEIHEYTLQTSRASPTGVAVDKDDYIYIVDKQNHQVLKYSPDGQYIRLIGKKGCDLGEFKHPLGVKCGSDNKLYVCDSGNSRIQVLNTDFTVASCFGGYGDGQGQFKAIRDIAFDSIGNVYVVDCARNAVFKLTKDGQYISEFHGTIGENDMLVAICIDYRDIIYVAEHTDHPNARVGRILVFNSNGTLLTSFGETQEQDTPCEDKWLNTPYGITVDEDGFVYVCDYGNSIKVF